MKISWIKTKYDDKSFKIFENLGFNVYNIENPKETDKIIYELIENDCKTIILSNEIASFSRNIIAKYNDNDDISIIISSGRNKERN